MKKYTAPELFTEISTKTSIMLESDVDMDMGEEENEE